LPVTGSGKVDKRALAAAWVDAGETPRDEGSAV
jgi:hypothetical protein